jgi:hypothetical protein
VTEPLSVPVMATRPSGWPEPAADPSASTEIRSFPRTTNSVSPSVFTTSGSSTPSSCTLVPEKSVPFSATDVVDESRLMAFGAAAPVSLETSPSALSSMVRTSPPHPPTNPPGPTRSAADDWSRSSSGSQLSNVSSAAEAGSLPPPPPEPFGSVVPGGFLASSSTPEHPAVRSTVTMARTIRWRRMLFGR